MQWFYIIDHIVWLAQLRILNLERQPYRRLKMLKNVMSIIAIVNQIIIDVSKYQHTNEPLQRGMLFCTFSAVC